MVGIGIAGMPFVHSAKRLGYAVHGVELPQRKFGYVGHVSAFTECRGLIDELWVEAAETAVLGSRPDGVLAFNEPHVLAASFVQERLGLPGPSLRAAVVSRNKALQRAVFATANIPQPDYFVREDIRDARDWAAQHLPVFIKPLSLTGGAGVEHLADEEALDAAVERRSGTGKLLVEAEVTGPEYSWVAVVVDGQVKISNISSTETSGPPYFIELVHRTPAVIGEKDRQEIDAIASRVLAALGMRTGIVQLECRLTADGPAVIEAAVRMPGDGLMELLEWTYGVNWYELAVMTAMGHDLPELPAEPHRYAAGYDPPLTGGVVTEVKGFDEIREHPMVIGADLVVSPGDLVPTSTSSMEVGGEFLIGAATSDELEEVLAHVRSSLRIETTPAEMVYQAKYSSAGASVYPLF
jgi:phosphoribosylaminoimidazole carboxylase (NCAIR synthetase)